MKIKQCPLLEDYCFKSKCCVETCKYYTEKTKNRCMALDTVFSSDKKGMTDAELRFLKLPERTKREVLSLRRDAHEKVQAILALHVAVRECREKDREVFPPENPVTEKITNHPLFSDPDLELDTWMLVYILDKDFMKQYGNPKTGYPKIHSLFGISDKEFEQFYPSNGA